MKIDGVSGISQPIPVTSQAVQVKQPVEAKQPTPQIQEKNIEIKTNLSNEQQAQTQDEKEHEVMRAIEKANKQIRTYDRKLEFSIHDNTKQIMVKVINTEDDSVIREIPSEKVLDMVAHLWKIAGILVDEKR